MEQAQPLAPQQPLTLPNSRQLDEQTLGAISRNMACPWGQSLSSDTVKVVALALMDKDGKVLLACRPKGKRFAGLWEFPGGKVEQGESDKAALAREVKEELGLDISPAALHPLNFAKYNDVEVKLFLCKDWQGTPKPMEGQSLCWEKTALINTYSMPPVDILLCNADWCCTMA